jgi:hypothetical protein
MRRHRMEATYDTRAGRLNWWPVRARHHSCRPLDGRAGLACEPDRLPAHLARQPHARGRERLARHGRRPDTRRAWRAAAHAADRRRAAGDTPGHRTLLARARANAKRRAERPARDAAGRSSGSGTGLLHAAATRWLEGDSPRDADDVRAARLKQRDPLLHGVLRLGVQADSPAPTYAVLAACGARCAA